MTRPVIAIGLDATDPKLLEHWMDLGVLPNLARFRDQGAFGWVNNVRYYRTETSWITFLTGALPARTGEWGHVQYDPGRYAADEHSAYGFIKYPPFYALMPERRVAVFDPPLARPVDGVNGIQIMGWGTEVNQCLRMSKPGPLMDELIARHGLHPMFEASPPEPGGDNEAVYSYRIPSGYDLPALEALRDRLVAGAGLRTQLMLDLLGREPWDLFLGVFSETHTASHLLWHTSQDHPLHGPLMMDNNADPLLDVFKAVDAGLGEILEAAPKDADVLLFSIYGIAANVLDLPSMAFLPELLFRWSFPGQKALGGTGEDAARLDYPGHWKDEIWNLRTPTGEARLESPAVQKSRGDPMHWQPSNWYRPLWPGMKAFALPTYSEGLIRINLQGRERDGLIAPEDYHRTCGEICDYLYAVKDGRTGKPMVREIVHRKTQPMDDTSLGPPADLIVLWQEESPTDLINSPQSGSIGPLPFFRSGGHCSRGFIAARGPGVEAGSRLESMQATDLTATFLHLLEQHIPDYIDGRPVLRCR
ncbi:MAG: alkaline phosphatase family protein [Pseudomonadota bacterium]